MTIKVTDVRKGMVVLFEGAPHLVVDFEHHTPGNLRAVNQLRLKNLKTGTVTEKRLSSSTVLDRAYLEPRKCQYLYKDQGHGTHVFMDLESYEQYEIPEDFVGDRIRFVKENQEVTVTFHEGAPLSLDLPPAVVLQVAYAEGAARGNTVNNNFKMARTDTGIELRVPNFIEAGELVRVSTETGAFLGRAK
jgi:elongation factor P